MNNGMAELKLYQCHKRVHALPMTRGEYHNYREGHSGPIPAGADSADPGYLVIYNKDTPDQYESWSPKHIFEAGYTEVPQVVQP